MDMPFCIRCDTIDGILIRLAKTSTKDGYKALCPSCKLILAANMASVIVLKVNE